MEVFREALEHLDRLKALAQDCVQSDVQLDDDVKEKTFENVVQLRWSVIEATRKTETERSQLDAAAKEELATASLLSSYASRTVTLTEKIQSAERLTEDSHRRMALEEANARLSEAKTRVSAKRELMEMREKKLKEFRHALMPALKLGSRSVVSEFDDAERIEAALEHLPIPLQFLYAQFRNAKSAFDLPIDVGIVARPKLSPMDIAHHSDAVSDPLPSNKKTRLPEKKTKSGTEEKRRKRWFEALAGKDDGTYDDWITTQRSLASSQLHSHNRPRPEMPSATSQRYGLLTELAEIVGDTSIGGAVPKKRKQQHGTKSSDAESSNRCPLPIPKGELCVEVHLDAEDKTGAKLVFVWDHGRAFVTSSPDAVLCRTIKQGDDAVGWENAMKAVHPQQYRSLVDRLGYPFEWAQSFCGIGNLKLEGRPTTEELKRMNSVMIEQQGIIADFVIRARSQSIELSSYRTDVKKLREAAEDLPSTDRKSPQLLRFRPVSGEKLQRPMPVARQRSSTSSFASGSWTVVMRKLQTRNGATEGSGTPMEIDGGSKQRFKIRFYPQSISDVCRRSGVDKNDIYYEAENPMPDAPIVFRPNEKMQSSTDGENGLGVELTGPLRSEDIDGRDDVIYGKLVVHKAVSMPKKFRGVLPIDYGRRFFPFELITARHSTYVDVNVPDHRRQLYGVYGISIQLDYVRLNAWIRVHLLQPSLPLIFVRGVMASAGFRKKSKATVKESKSKTVDGKSKTEHGKTERDRLLKSEAEAMSLGASIEWAIALLEGDGQQDVPKASEKEMPIFWCDDAKHWIAERVSNAKAGSLEEAVGKLQELLAEWCSINAQSVEALSIFLEHGTTSKPKEKSASRHDRRRSKSVKERKDGVQGRHHEEELEQGEIPSVPKSKHAKHRTPRRTPRMDRRMHRTSPQRSRASTDPRSRTMGRTGNTRVEGDNRERSRSSLTRLRR